MAHKRISVLVSGRGSNLAALVEASQASGFSGAVTQVIGSKVRAPALEIARSHGIPTSVVDPEQFAVRDAFDAALGAALDASEPDLVILAGFMRILGDTLVGRYGQVRDRVTATTAGQDAAALVHQWAGVLEGVVEDGRDRAAALLAVQAPARRWPWAVGAAVLGAAAGAAVALAVRRLVGQDAPDAQDPEQLRAVVDTGRTGPASL